MAIDLMLMPLSRYFSGDYITPTMRYAWDEGVPYTVIYGDGTERVFPPGIPWGGEDAAEERKEIIPHIDEALEQLFGELEETLWNESSDEDPEYYRFDATDFDAFITAAESVLGDFTYKPKLEDGSDGPTFPAHILSANVYLPVEFVTVFPWIDDRSFGSIHSLQHELNLIKESKQFDWEKSESFELWSDAVKRALEVNQPLIMDS